MYLNFTSARYVMVFINVDHIDNCYKYGVFVCKHVHEYSITFIFVLLL